ncbi:elongation factor 1-beta [archaeon]|nr:elongation factor 1-beta [archaeon]
MAIAVVTIKLMMKSTDISMKEVEDKARKKITKFYSKVGEIRVEQEPIAFGLMALNLTFALDESLGTEKIEGQLKRIKGVASSSVIDYRRAIG